MTITPEIKQALDRAGGSPVELTDPQNNTAYVIVPADVDREMQELLGGEKGREAVARKARRNAASRMEES